MNPKPPNARMSQFTLAVSMVIFGTVPLIRHYIPLSSPLVAFFRGLLGTLVLLLAMLVTHHRFDRKAVQANLWRILLSGALLGLNWITLFESFRFTTVSVATLCNNFAPIFVVLVAPFIFKEKLTKDKIVCVIVSAIGILFVSGFLGDAEIGSLKGVFLALCSAALYGTIVILNKTIIGVHAYDKTLLQLGACATALLPYILLTEKPSAIQLNGFGLAMLIIAGVVHTGIAYVLYFGSMDGMKAQTVALMSYIGPGVSLLGSTLLLKEPMTWLQGVGAILILGTAFFSGRDSSQPSGELGRENEVCPKCNS